MIRYKNLILIGTSHIAASSIREVETVIRLENPTIVALELDRQRFHGLLEKKPGTPPLRMIKHFGFKGYLFARIGHYVEHKLGNAVGVSPGSEMLRAAQVAQEHHAKIALIDQPIDITLKRFTQHLTWRERFRFISDLATGIFKKQKIPFDLHNVPPQELIQKLVGDVKKRYPSVYTTLIAERNVYMAKRLHSLMQHHEGTIVGIIGAGHEEEIVTLVRHYEQT